MTLADRSLRAAIAGSIPDDDPNLIDDMQAELERLRAALMRITDPSMLPPRGISAGDALIIIHAMRKIASEALQ